MTALIDFMASAYGRIFRAAVGVVLVVLGALASGVTMTVLVILGAFFIGVGLFDVCVLAPLAGLPFTGKGIRARHS
jgi:hypothetical protein